MKLARWPNGKIKNEYDKIIRDLYPDGGPKMCQSHMPDFDLRQITRRANYIGVVMNPEASARNGFKKTKWTELGYDKIIKERYPNGGPSLCKPDVPLTSKQITSRAKTLGVRLTPEAMTESRKKRALVAAETKRRNNANRAKSAGKLKKLISDSKNDYVLLEDVALDPFISGPVPESIYKERLKCEYYLQQ